MLLTELNESSLLKLHTTLSGSMHASLKLMAVLGRQLPAVTSHHFLIEHHRRLVVCVSYLRKLVTW